MGKRALVTGAASGIGAACVRRLVSAGADRLVLVDREQIEMETFGAIGVDWVALRGDVANPDLWQEVEAAAGPLDWAVLNAGIAAGGTVAQTEFDEWRRVLGTNLDGAFPSLRSAMRLASDGASIVLTASVSGLKAEAGTSAYGASKAGVIQLAKIAAKEGAPRRIRVSVIAPGGVDTPIWDQVPFFQNLVEQHGDDRDGALAAMAKMGTPLGRYASADEIAARIAFLLSDEAATITGTVLVSDGGYSL